MEENKNNLSNPTADSPVFSMPAEFYGGANPIIKFKNVEKEVNLNKMVQTPAPTAVEKILADKITAAGGDKKWHPANLLTNRKFLIIGGILFFIIFILCAAAYYWWQAKSAVIAPRPVPIVSMPEPAPVVIPTSTIPEIVPEEEIPPVVVPEQPAVLSEAAMEFPSKLYSDSNDLDKDDLTDMAEELFGIDPGISDTDGDGYGDGHEVYNLYNPNGKEPIKLIDSETVLEYTNPIFGYKLYYPASWAVGNVDSEYKDVLFSTITGENIEVRVFDLQAGQDFAGWFDQTAKGESYNDLTDFSSVFKEKALRRSEYLVYYFNDGQKVFVIAYHTTDSNIINYRSVIKMMARSFRLSGNITAVPAPVDEGAASSPAFSTSSGGAPAL